MANTRLSMRKIKEFLRLTHHGGLSDRQVALSLDISRSTVKDYRARAQRAGLSWPVPEALSDEALGAEAFSANNQTGSATPNRFRTLTTSTGS